MMLNNQMVIAAFGQSHELTTPQNRRKSIMSHTPMEAIWNTITAIHWTCCCVLVLCEEKACSLCYEMSKLQFGEVMLQSVHTHWTTLSEALCDRPTNSCWHQTEELVTTWPSTQKKLGREYSKKPPTAASFNFLLFSMEPSENSTR